MAFCPHCGKSVGEQATRCAACGGELEARGKPARFKGTMMMSPGTAPLIQPPHAGQPPATAPTPAAPAPASPVAATLPMPAVGPIAEAAAALAAGKKPSALKATMLGTGDGLGGIAQSLGAMQPQQPPAPAPAPVAAAPAPAPAPAPTPAPLAEPAAAPAPQAQPAATTRREVAAHDDDSKRFLVGDPMAPAGAPPISRPQRVSRLSQDIPKDRSAMYIAVGVVGVCVIAALGYLAARLLGLA